MSNQTNPVAVLFLALGKAIAFRGAVAYNKFGTLLIVRACDRLFDAMCP